MDIKQAAQVIQAFGRHYDYDVSHMEMMLRVSPEAYRHFSVLTELSQHRQAAPIEAIFAAKLVGAVFEDCGPCVQLVSDMAVEAGVELTEVEAILTGDRRRMNPSTVIGFRFAEALVRRLPELNDAREVVQDQWGEAGVIDLTLACQIGRVFPMVKSGLGFGQMCQRVKVGDHTITVRHPVAEAA